MIEILGGKLDAAFEALGIKAVKTYEGNTHLDNLTQIWEVDEEGFNRLCGIKEEKWDSEWGWWRSAEGSNMDTPLSRFNINNHYIKAWNGQSRLSESAEDWYQSRKYSNLLEYFCEEIGASTARNVCALAVHLSEINNIKMSELFKKYQG